jgi:hypothetical protein
VQGRSLKNQTLSIAIINIPYYIISKKFHSVTQKPLADKERGFKNFIPYKFFFAKLPCGNFANLLVISLIIFTIFCILLRLGLRGLLGFRFSLFAIFLLMLKINCQHKQQKRGKHGD